MKYLSRLNDGVVLKRGDHVEFQHKGDILTYVVDWGYLNNMGFGANDEIFDRIGVPAIKFCRKAYGYEPTGGDWPTANHEDYPALTRAANAIYDALKEQTPLKNMTEDEIFKMADEV